jgi:multidrug efflux pump subunit AcrB
MNRAIAWFATNSVAANLLLLLITVGGIVTIPSIRQEVFPEISVEVVTVAVPYPGAAPQEVEEGICVRVEEQLNGIDGIDRIHSTAREGVGQITIELETDADVQRTLDEIKARVDAIDTFPEEAEKPVVQQIVVRQSVLSVAIAGDADERALKLLGQQVRDDLAALPDITHVDLTLARPYEIAIEVSEAKLQRHGLTFSDVADAVRRTSIDLPGGSIKSDSGEILLRTKGQAYRGAEFERLALLSKRDGTRLTVGDVADVIDGFRETDQSARFDGKPAVLVQVFRVGQQSALRIASAVQEYVERTRPTVPEGIELIIWDDSSEVLRARLATLLGNGRDGFILVVAVLALFLKLRVAFWVILGVPVCFLGTLWLMPLFDISINVISLFAFIVVLGVLVDDAIVIGENIHVHQQRGRHGRGGAIAGATQVAIPVTFGVLTTIAAFAPLMAIPGPMGKLMLQIPLCVMAALGFSLIESTLILPAHLAHERTAKRPPSRLGALWEAFQLRVAADLDAVVDRFYRPSLERAIAWRYLTVAIGIAALLVTLGLTVGGWVRFTFFPAVEADNVVAFLTMPQGTPARVTAEAVATLEASANRVLADIEAEQGQSPLRHLMATVGEQPFKTRQSRSVFAGQVDNPHLGEVNLALLPSEERSLSSREVMRRWRHETPPIAGAVEVTFSSALITSGEPINIQLQGNDLERLVAAANRVKEHLAGYPGVADIADSFREGKREVKLQILPSAEALGITMAQLGRQVRQAFYGEEAQRIQRGRDDVRVMVRYPAEYRRSLADIEQMRVRTPDGGEVAFHAVAATEIGRGYASINRVDRQRVVNVTADVDVEQANANEIIETMQKSFLPGLRNEFPGVRWSLEGEQRDQAEFMGAMTRGFILAILAIYALLAIPLGSYGQPLIIMSAIPFGLIGAIWGHAALGWDLSMFSMIGIVALTGVVVNDSLVLVSYVNETREEGVPLLRAVREAGAARFRPILLTSLTTFAGLTPLMMERSVQAQFLIPMAISLAFGVLFATAISLVMVPALYVILEDFRAAPATEAVPRPRPEPQS